MQFYSKLAIPKFKKSEAILYTNDKWSKIRETTFTIAKNNKVHLDAILRKELNDLYTKT